MREIRDAVAGRLVAGRVPDPVEVLARIGEVQAGDWRRPGRRDPGR
jgi:hypothetical protein